MAKRLQEPNHGFSSYGMQQWLAITLGIEAEYHAVYQMTYYRLKAKLKVARPQNCQLFSEQPEAFKQTSKTTSTCSNSMTTKNGRVERPLRYFAQDESRFGLHTLIGRGNCSFRGQTDWAVAMVVQSILALWGG